MWENVSLRRPSRSVASGTPSKLVARRPREHGQAHFQLRSRHPNLKDRAMLAESEVATRLPVKDLDRARRFYSEKLGLEPVEARPGALRYRCASGSFALFESTGASSGSHTQMAWEVDDIESTVAALRSRGVVFE